MAPHADHADHTTPRNRVLALVGAVLALGILVPYEMDEFSMYHVLACWQPAQQLNTWREACGGYPISLGPLHFQRAYEYLGATSSLLFAPFHALWGSIWMNYIVGGVFLAAQTAGLARSFRLPRAVVPALTLAFPLAYVAVHDSGPTRVSLTVLAWTPYVVRKFAESGRLMWLAVVVATWVVATEDKPYFLFVAPGAAVLTLAAVPDLPRTRRTVVRVVSALALAGGASLGLLMALRTPSGSYLSLLRGSTPTAQAGLDISTGVRDALLFTVDWPVYAHRVNDYAQAGGALMPHSSPTYGIIPAVLTVVVSVFVAGLYWWALAAASKRSSQDRAFANLMVIAWAALNAGAIAAGGWANHHYIYAQVPLLVLTARELARLPGRTLVHGSTAVFLASTVAVTTTPTWVNSSRELESVVSFVATKGGERPILNCATWGCYYTWSLNAPRDLAVTWADSPQQAAQLADVAAQRGSSLYETCVQCTTQQTAGRYPGASVAQVDTGTTTWVLFRITPVTR